MTPKKDPTKNEKGFRALEEICENTRAIRRVANRILDHLHEQLDEELADDDPDSLTWDDLTDNDDMYL
jgi:hypothetical protein